MIFLRATSPDNKNGNEREQSWPLLNAWGCCLKRTAFLLVPRVRLSVPDTAVLQNHGGQSLLGLSDWPLSGLTGGVRLWQKHWWLKVQSLRAPLFHLRRSCLVVRLVVAAEAGSVLDHHVPPPALIQTVVTNDGLQAASFSFREVECFGMFPGKYPDVTCMTNRSIS